MKVKTKTKRCVKMLIIALLVSVVILCTGIAMYATDTASGVLSTIATVSPTLSADGKSIILPGVPDGYTVSVNGTSNESVIDIDGNVYTPLVDTTVKVNYKVTKIEDGMSAVDNYQEASIVINGKYTAEKFDNAEPAVLPKLQEWKGGQGSVKVSESSRIVVSHAAFMPQAELINEYFADILGSPLEIVTDEASAGDIIIGYADAKELGKEGYTVELSDRIIIEAYSETGALYGGTTVAQMLTLYEGYELPQGYIRDYPAYEVRSSMIDVARHYLPLEQLVDTSKYLAYFKVNQIHVHINDNGGQQNYAFRVESKRYPEINSSLGDNVYSQEDYRAYQTELLKYGVKVITEIDSPAHAGFAGLYDSSLVISSDKGKLDLTDNYDGVVTFMKGLVDEFVNGYDGNPSVIIDEIDTIHLGMDEYYYNHDQYKVYMKEMCDYTKSLGKCVQVWSALKTADFSEELPITPENTIVNYWGDADLKAYANLDFPAVSNYPLKLYVVPGVTNAFGDWIDIPTIYDSYEANVVSSSLTFAESSPLLLGVEGAIWHDNNAGHSKEGVFARVRDQMLLVSEKAWHGKAEGVTGEQFEKRLRAIQDLVPIVNPQSFVPSNEDGVVADYDFDEVENGKIKDTAQGLDATLNEISVSNSKLTLNGTGYISLPIDQIGFPYTVSFGLTYSSTTSGILFAGGDSTFWLNKNADGKITFARELHTFGFDFVFVKNLHYDIMLVCDRETISLYVDGVYIEDAHVISAETGKQNLSSIKFSESVLSTSSIGEGIVGTLDSLKILGSADKVALSGIDNMKYGNVALGKNTSASGTEVNYKWFPENAVDGITEGSDFKVSLNRVDNAWLTIDLGEVYSIDKIKIYFLQSPVAYKFLISVDGINYTEVYNQPSANAAKKSTDTIELGTNVAARYVKYQQVEMFSATLSNGNVAKYSGSFAEIEVYGSEIAINKNLALGKEVVECTYNENGTTGVPQDLTDGNNEASWSNRVCFEKLDEVYFTVDLESECLISGVNLYWYQKANKYQVYVSSDRRNWTLAYEDLSGNGGSKTTDCVSIPGDVIGRYVRVMLTECFEDSNGNLYCGSIAEVEVIGTRTDIGALDTIDRYLKTLDGDAKTHLYNRVALVKRIISKGNTDISAVAIKLLYEEYERMLNSSYTLDTSKGNIYNALLDIKLRKHASSSEAYAEYVEAYKLTLSAYINSKTDTSVRTNRLSMLNSATLKIAKPDSIETDFTFADLNLLKDGNVSTYYATTETTQAVGNYFTINYNNPITFASIRLATKDINSSLSTAKIEYSLDGTTFTTLKEINSAGNIRDYRFGVNRKNMCELVVKNPIDNVVAIRITVTASSTKKLQLAEILVNENIDLDVLIPEASGYLLENYTTASIFPFVQYHKSEAVSRALIDNIATYIRYLVPKADVEAVNAKISELQAIDTTLYTDSSVAVLNAAIASAESFVSSINDNVSIYASDDVIEELCNAKNALVRNTAINTAELESAIASASVNSWEYTYYSYKFLSDTVYYAKSLLNNANATQEIINEACIRVNYAISKLETRGTRVNVALNKNLIISGRESASSLGPELAVDGDLTTRFSPNREDGAYFIIDLGEILTIDTIEAVWNHNPRKYNIQISVDNKKYVTVYESYDSLVFGKAVTDTINFEEAVQARYVKFDLVSRFLGSSDQHTLYSGSPNEVMIYSADMTPSKSELQYLVDLYANGITQSFAPECKAKIEAALAEAEALLANDSATAEEIEALVNSLTHTTDALNFKFANNSVHTHTCPCGVSVSEEHIFDAGTVAMKPSAFEEGEMVYTCSVCGGNKTEAIPTVDLYLSSMKLNLAESINVVYIAEVKEDLTDPYLIVKLLDKEYKLTKYTVRADGRYEFVFKGATPSNMIDDMSATLYAKRGDETVSSDERSFTIREYCAAVLKAYSADVKLRTLISDILVYGAALQNYVGHETDNLATSSVPRLTSSEYDETITSKLLISGTANGYKWISAGLVCTGRMSVDFKFECANPDDTVIRFTVCGREMTYNVSDLDCDSDGRYSIRLNGIMAYEFDETITAEFVTDGEAVGEKLNFSVNSYIVYMNELYASSTNETELKLVELVRAISCYGNSAKAYYEQIKGEK